MKDKITFDTKRAKDFFLEKISFLTTAPELKRNIEQDVQSLNIVDVRKYDDFIDGHIPFAEHIPLDRIEEYLYMLEKDKINVFYTYSDNCQMAFKAGYIAASHNYPSVVLFGGFKTWKNLEYDVVKTSAS